MFLVDGRDSDVEIVKVREGEPVQVCEVSDADGLSQEKQGSAGEGDRTESAGSLVYDGITTLMTEHSITMFLDEAEFNPGASIKVMITTGTGDISLTGVVTQVEESRRSFAKTYTMEILDFGEYEADYIAFIYDRIPTLPQSLKKDLGVIPHPWTNIAYRVARTVKS